MTIPAERSGTARLRWDVAGVVALGVLVDQATKAVADDHIVNEGGTSYLLPHFIRLLWAHPHIGAALDLLDVVPLVLVCRLAVRARHPATRAGWALMFAGWASNWADRLGMSALTKPGSPRGAVDWIQLPGWPGVYNVADVLIVVGAVLLTVVGARRLAGDRPLLAATASLCLLAVWVGVWSGDRRATQSSAAADQLHGPLRAMEQERARLDRRTELARAATAVEQVRTARAALGAHLAGVPHADRLLPAGYRFACWDRSAGTCAVVASSGSAATLVYPLRRPVWAAGLWLPFGICDEVSDRDVCAGADLTPPLAGPR